MAAMLASPAMSPPAMSLSNVELGAEDTAVRESSVQVRVIPSEPSQEIPKPFLGPDPEFDPDAQPPPEPYYWQEPPDEAAKHTWWNKLAQNLHFYGVKLLEGGEAVGGTVASVLGLTDSQFQYVIDSLEHQEWERLQSLRDAAAPDTE